MKIYNKFIFTFIFCLLCCLLSFYPMTYSKINAKSKYTTFSYAQIKADDVYLYRSTSSTSATNAYFALPYSYFVLLISNIDNNFYKVQYRDVIGYVLKDNVTPVAEQPQNPYLTNISFWVYTTDGTNMLSSPHKTGKVVASVETFKNIDYYGYIIGDEYIKNRGYTWYYCKDGENMGYLYKGLCDNLSAIPQNTEKVTAVSSPFVEDDNSFLYNLVDMTGWLKALLILAVCLPSLGLIYLMFKPFNLQNKKLKKPQKSKAKLKAQTINKIQKIIDDEPL